MKIEDLKEGDPVVYIPNHLLGEKTIKDYQLGIVSSKNDLYVFVKYKGAGGGQATRPDDLYTLDYRPDLLHRLGIEVTPINRVCELWIEDRINLAKNWKK